MKVTPDMFARTNNDVNGNPRYILHYLMMLTEQERESRSSHKYEQACARATIAGGRAYTGRDYGGGIVFQSYSLDSTCDHINSVVERAAELQGAGALAWIVDAAGKRAGALVEHAGGFVGRMHAGQWAGADLVPRGGAPYATEGAAKAGIRRAGYRIA